MVAGPASKRHADVVTADETPGAIRFAGQVARLWGDRTISIEDAPPGPPQRIDGYTLGVVAVDVGPGPHRGEMHPDGDEFLFVSSGSMSLVLDDGDAEHVGTETAVELRAGDAYVVPRGTWHRLIAGEPSQLVHATPGPNGPARPLS